MEWIFIEIVLQLRQDVCFWRSGPWRMNSEVDIIDDNIRFFSVTS